MGPRARVDGDPDRRRLMSGYSNARVNSAIYSPSTADFTQRDWLDLAMAAIDQSGIGVALQERIEAMLPETEDAADEGGAS